MLATFFDTYLPETRRRSKNTILSYADGFVVLFRCFREVKGKVNYFLNLKDLTPRLVDEYVLWMQNTMCYSAATQEQRLAVMNFIRKFPHTRA
ncbi:MAG: site-specific integrase [Oscillospiraceae bacterium]|nr:site-specific integrase [Oscillospiraceae bacterium]